ncbi:MAG: glycine oxidase ThiO, partial [Stellaceae bacterium]
AGSGASGAAAGMLAAGLEAEPGEQALLGLNRESQAMWPDFAAALEQASGMAVNLRQEGTLMLALTRDDAARLKFNFDFQRSLGIPVEWLTAGEARKREPYLSPNVAAAIFSPEDHQVDNRLVVTALARAFVNAGGTIHEDAPVDSVEIASGRVAGLRVDGTLHAAQIVVLAAGAWSHEIAGLPTAAKPPVRPVKGQMLALQMNPDAPLIRHVVWAAKAYMAPRLDGRLIVGATVEERGFDPHLTAGGMFALLEGAWRAIPGIEELPIAEQWVGFRPGSRDDAPILGASGIEGLVHATGHYRNGILLTPITARAVAHYIMTGETEAAIAPFRHDRFKVKTPA